MGKKNDISDADLLLLVNEWLDYMPATGIFLWKKVNGQKMKVGQRAGGKSHGYRIIKINKIPYYEHRLAYIVKHKWLPEFIDHIDRVKDNNHITNLRAATESQNGSNKTLRSDNKSGTKGVCWNKRRQNWQVRISANGVAIYLGSFIDLTDAIAARRAGDLKYHGEFSCIEAKVI